MVSAHRVAYRLAVGDIPKDQFVLHRCDNRKCINPAHLFLGTHQDNMDDMVNKGRTNPIKGSSHANSKLAEQDVLSIRILLSEGTSLNKLATKFNVSKKTMFNIKHAKIWRHI